MPKNDGTKDQDELAIENDTSVEDNKNSLNKEEVGPELAIEDESLEEVAEEEAEDDIEQEARELPDEVKASLEKTYPVLQEHGTHNAAMSGLQTDASGHRDSVHDVRSEKSGTRI